MPEHALVDSRPGKLGGETCFAGTRVPVSILFHHLAAGGTVDAFCRGYDWIPRDQVAAVIRLAGQRLRPDVADPPRPPNDDHGYPIGRTDLRGLARATYRNSDTLPPIHPAVLDPEADPPPQPTWRRWLDKHRRRDPNVPPDELLPSASREKHGHGR